MTVDSPQQFSLSFPDIDSLTESIEGFDLRFLELEREGGGFQMNMLSTPVAMVSQISVSSRVRQEGAPVEGFVTFGLVTDTCGGMRWNNYRLNQSSILVFPNSQQFNSITPAGFQGTSIAIEREKLAQIAEHYQLAIDIETLDSRELAVPISREKTEYLQRLIH